MRAIGSKGVSVKTFRTRSATLHDFRNFLQTLPLTSDFPCANRTTPRGGTGSKLTRPPSRLADYSTRKPPALALLQFAFTSRGVPESKLYFFSLLSFRGSRGFPLQACFRFVAQNTLLAICVASYLKCWHFVPPLVACEGGTSPFNPPVRAHLHTT